MFETEEAKQFFAAWQALRNGDELPHFRVVFQHLPTDMLPHILIVELIGPEAHVVRFMARAWPKFANATSPARTCSSQ